MSLERRLVGCVLLLAAAAGLPLALLPEHVSALTVPMAATGAALLFALLPLPRVIQALGWLAGAGVVTVFLLQTLDPGSVAVLAIVPLGVLLLTDRAVLSAVGTAVVIAAVVHVVDPLGRPGLSWATPTDVAARAALLGWSAWLVTAPIVLRSARRRAALLRSTAAALDEAIARDQRWLGAVAQQLCDPGLVGPVRGAGLRPDSLAVATRIDERRVLIGWLDGDPLATLSAAWAIAAAGRAGERNPRALLRYAREHLDEVLPIEGISWLAVWDRRTGALACTRHNAPAALQRCTVTDRGPVEVGARPAADDAEEVLRSLLASPGELTDVRLGAGAPIAAFGVGLGAAAATLFPLPVYGLAIVVAALLTGHALARCGAMRRDRGLSRMHAQLRERTELHDEIRYAVARLHGGLLPYRVQVGAYQATAHRLRGEVTSGCFADLVCDGQGFVHVVAGEVAGRGIAARFLGLAAQAAARTLIEAGETRPERIDKHLHAHLQPLARALGYPLRLRLGTVTVDGDGSCHSYGTLGRLVVVRGVAEGPRLAPLARSELASIERAATIDGDTRVYLSPAPSVPGPEDDAPALDTQQAADRIVQLVRRRQWRPGEESLASLFARVFDGRRAPSHGTLVELSMLRPQHDARDPEGDREGEQRDATRPLAAV